MKTQILIKPLILAVIAFAFAQPASWTFAQGNGNGNGNGNGGGEPAFSIEPFMAPNTNSVSSFVNDINEQNQAVGGMELVDGSRQAIYRDNSGTYAILAGGEAAGGINNLNEIVGSDEFTALYWSSPSADPVTLPPLDGDIRSWAYRINDDGIILGSSWDGIPGNTVSVVWRVFVDDDDMFQVIGPVAIPGNHSSTDLNQVINGTAQILSSDEQQAMLTEIELNPNGSFSIFSPSVGVGTLGIHAPSWSIGYGLNNLGHVCGLSDGHPFVALARQAPFALSVPRKIWHASAEDINDHGDVVGYAEHKIKGYSNPPGAKHAKLWQAGERIDLTGQLPRKSGWDRLTKAYVINNNGMIGGYGRYDVQIRGFILIPNQ